MKKIHANSLAPSQEQLNNLIKYYQTGQYKDAEKLASSLTEKFPKHTFSWKVLSAVLKQIGKINEALIAMQRSIQLSPQDAEAYSNLGVTLQELGKLDEAEQRLRQAIKIKPDFAEAHYNMGVIFQQLKKLDEAEQSFRQAIKIKPDYVEAHSNLGVIFQQLKKLDEAEQSFIQAIKIKPDYVEAHYNMGVIFQELKKLDEAEQSFRQAIKIKPDFTEAYSNLGVIFQQLKKLDEAEQSFIQAIKLKPDFAEAHYNMGVTLQELGKLDEAEQSLRQAIKIKPDYVEAHSNLGVTLQELGKLDEAEQSLTYAIKLKPDYTDAQDALVLLLTTYSFQKKTTQPIIKADQEIKKIDLKGKASEIITDDKIVRLFSKSSTIIERYNLKLKTKLSQIYRRDTVYLNCDRHLGIFNKSNIIPEFCFGCFKVQVEPRSVLELIKLFLVFDQIKLNKNNTRKCMIEMRPKISGFYKGIVYCSSAEEAYQIADYLETIIKNNIRPGLPALVKRGCSEYSFPYPDFKKINRSGVKLMNYNKNWKLFEEDYDSKNSIKNKKILNSSLSCLNLNDIIIIRNWIDYAKGIGDQSVELLNQQTVSSQKIYNIAKKRLATYPWLKPKELNQDLSASVIE